MVQREKRGMIRNGMQRKQAARQARRQLIERWQGYPHSIQLRLERMLQRYGPDAAHLALEVLDLYAASIREAEKGHSDATPAP